MYVKYSNPLYRIYNATLYSLSGLYYAFTQEQAFKYEAVVLAALIVASILAGLPLMTFVLLIGSWLAVMAFELVNSAIEQAFNLIDSEYNTNIKAGKDMLSAAIFLMIMFNIALWAALVARCYGGVGSG
jgi:diacylglycerol kinase (ATP)